MSALPLYPPTRPQSIGEVLDSAFQILRRALVRSIPYGVLIVIAGELANIHDLVLGHPLRGFARSDPVWWAWYVCGLMLTLLLWGALLIHQSELAQGRVSNVGQELRIAATRLPVLLGVFILSMLALALGLVLLIVPGLYLMVPFAFTFPIVLLRRVGAIEALRFSVRLVIGNWWRTMLILSVALLVSLAFYTVAPLAAAIVLALTRVSDVAVISAVTSVALVAMGAVSLPFTSAVLLATYGELLVRREGADLERRIAAAAES